MQYENGEDKWCRWEQHREETVFSRRKERVTTCKSTTAFSPTSRDEMNLVSSGTSNRIWWPMRGTEIRNREQCRAPLTFLYALVYVHKNLRLIMIDDGVKVLSEASLRDMTIPQTLTITRSWRSQIFGVYWLMENWLNFITIVINLVWLVQWLMDKECLHDNTDCKQPIWNISSTILHHTCGNDR